MCFHGEGVAPMGHRTNHKARKLDCLTVHYDKNSALNFDEVLFINCVILKILLLFINQSHT